jgi:hypothetical protein
MASLLPALVASSAIDHHATTTLPPGLFILSATHRPPPSQSFDHPPQESRLVVCLFDTIFRLTLQSIYYRRKSPWQNTSKQEDGGR